MKDPVEKHVVEKDFKACYNKALHLLSLRPHFTRELESKLRQREFLEQDINTTIERLSESGFLDDATAARQFAKRRRERLGEVGARLVQELRKRGVDADLAGQVIGSLDDGSDVELAFAQVDKLRARGVSDERIARRLNRKGFSKADILRALSEQRSDST